MNLSKSADLLASLAREARRTADEGARFDVEFGDHSLVLTVSRTREARGSKRVAYRAAVPYELVVSSDFDVIRAYCENLRRSAQAAQGKPAAYEG